MANLSKKRVAIVIAVIIVLVAIITPIAYFVTREDKRKDVSDGGQPILPTIPEKLEQRIDCYPEGLGGYETVTKVKCEKRNCVYHDSGITNVPTCFFPIRREHGFSVLGETENMQYGFRMNLKQKGKVPFGSPFKRPVFEVEMRDENVLRFKFDDAGDTRYKVPMELDLPRQKTTRETAYELNIIDKQNFAFEVKRKSTGKVIWSTGVGGLTLSDQFLQLSTALPSKNVYGFGENLHWSFRHNMSFQTWPMFSRDQPPFWKDKANLYGVHPFYTCVEDDGNTHGVLLLNSNAQDYSFTPLPMLTYRTIGGILDFYVFMGPTPENVVQKYTQAVGRPFMPPYWSLGFQLCRYGYNSLTALQEAVNRTRDYGIPQDVQYADIDHMDEQKDFTVNNKEFNGLNDTFTALREGGMRTIIILDPCFIAEENYEPYDRLKSIAGAIMWPSGEGPTDSTDTDGAMLGYVWPNGKVVFPDFFKNKTKQLWKELIVKHRKTLVFDAMWIDMNEPANFGTNQPKPWNWPKDNTDLWSLKCSLSKYDDSPYRTMAAYVHDDQYKARLSNKTICMVARQGDNNDILHYNVHSLYGWSQTEPTLQAVREATGERSMVLSRSTFPGSGKYTGHWLGDNDSKWHGLHTSIIGMLEFNLFGIPYIGADICGFFGNTTVELCKRWMQLGAFYPFSRNHNGIGFIPQDPGVFGEEVALASKEALETRYWLLPYLYTLFYDAHIHGHTVVRPLHHEFPKDTVALGIDTQFLWGGHLLISPILTENQRELKYYLPEGRWYNFYNGGFIDGPENITMPVYSNTKITLHIRGGSIIPMQEPARNTTYSRKNPMTLLVALDKFDTDGGMADGELFWDDGISIDTYESGKYVLMKFHASKNVLSVNVATGIPKEANDLVLSEIIIRGVKRDVKSVIMMDTLQDINSFTYNNTVHTLTISSLSLHINESFRITWQDTTQEEQAKIDCYPERLGGIDHVTEAKCLRRHCLYTVTESQSPDCYFPSNYGYKVVGDEIKTTSGWKVNLEWIGFSPFYKALRNVTFEIEMRDNYLLRFKFYDTNEDRYEVPVPLDLPDNTTTNPNYQVNITSRDPFHFKIYRKSTGTVLWDTSVGGFTLEDQFLQISTKLPSANIYGFGENVHDSFRHDLNWKSWPMFSRDQPTGGVSQQNHYGVHPYYMCMENDGNSHGVLLLNSNAQDYSFTPLPMLTYRTIGGILDFYMFLGPEPEQVVQQYTGVIGKPYMPPYWSLGFQLCRYGYNDLKTLQEAVDRTRKAGIPHDVQYADIDHMYIQRDFTVDQDRFGGLGDYFREIQSDGMHTIIILDPALITTIEGYTPYDYMKKVDGNIKWPKDYNVPTGSNDSNNALLGYVWPTDKVVFPDFFKDATADIWKNLTVTHHHVVPFDGLWIDMNEPANFGTNEERPWNWPEDKRPYWSLKCNVGDPLEDPPYRTMAAFVYDKEKNSLNRISDKTICMVARQGPDEKYRHYDVHSLYGWSQSLPTLQGLQAATGQRGIVISRSTFPGSGKHVGHWLGDNASTWPNVRLSIIGLLEFNLFGIPYIGADICGFFDNSNAELCKRWMQLGAFYTFSRNHNGKGYIPQDPAVFGEDVVKASREALNTRYWLLPYLYTLFHHAHSSGHTVIRPLHHEFPKDKNTYGIDQQFLWGSALLISPILQKGQTVLNMYFPEGRWYDYYTGQVVTKVGQSGHQIHVFPDTKIPLHVRGGYILPLQVPANNTHYSRRNPFKLKVALAVNGDVMSAKGDLFWDDGVSINATETNKFYYSQFYCNGNMLNMTINQAYPSIVDNLYINSVQILCYDRNVSSVLLDNIVHNTYQYDYHNKILNINNVTIPLSRNFTLKWQS